MDNAPHLQNEDKPEFAKVLDETLRAPRIVEGLRRTAHLNAAQLRTRALSDAPAIAEAAAPEYVYYTTLRTEVREAAAARSTPAPHPAEPPSGAYGFESAGLVPVMAVLAPILAGIAAIVFLLVGYVLRGADSSLAIGRQLVTAGWVTLAVGGVALVVGIVGLLLTAARDGAAPPDGGSPERYAELATARDGWRRALRDRGLLPYLHEQLAQARALDDAEDVPLSGAPGTAPRGATGLLPEREQERSALGFTDPGFTSPGFTSPGVEGFTDPEGHPLRHPDPGLTDPGFSEPVLSDPGFSEPGYTHPGFTSPGVEGITDEHGRPEPTDDAEPHFISPGYTSPAFTSPDDVPTDDHPAPPPFPPRRPRRPPSS